MNTIVNDCNESSYVYKQLKEETNFGKLKLNEKESLNALIRSRSFQRVKRPPLELFHDDYFFTENKTSLYRKNLSACSSLNTSMENFYRTESKKKLNNQAVCLKKSHADIDSEEETMVENQEDREYLCTSLKEELKFGKLGKNEKAFIFNKNKAHKKCLNKKSDPYLNAFSEDFFLSDATF